MKQQTLVWCLALVLFGNALFVNNASGKKIEIRSLDEVEDATKDKLGANALNRLYDGSEVATRAGSDTGGENGGDIAPGKGSGEKKPEAGKGSGEQKPESGKGSGEQGKPGKGSGEQGKPGNGSGEQGKPGNGSGEQGKPGKGSSEQGKPGNGSGEQGKPGKGSGEQGKPGKGSGEQGKPGNGSGEQGKPGQGSGDQGKPGKGSGEQDKPGNGSGEQGKPGNGSGEQGKPGKGSGEQGKPGNGSGEQGKPGNGSGEQGKPGKGSGEQGKPGKGSGEQGKPGKGSGEQGKPGNGSGEQGKPGKGSGEDPAKVSEEGSSDGHSSEWHYNPQRQTIFTLHTTETSAKGKIIKLGDRESLKNSGFNPSKQTRILIHHSKNKDSSFNNDVTEAYLKKGKFNVIVVNWEKGTRGNQRQTLRNAIDVGKVVASFVDFLVTNSKTSIKSIYLIGYGLGAHVAGIAGRTVSSGVIPVIFALDPTNISRSWMSLSKYDAKYVELIYTSTASSGRGRPDGHTSFFVNYGRKQPGCENKDDKCSQKRAYEYFAESINSETGFYGKSCGSARQLISSKRCTNGGEKIEKMGGYSARDKEYGIFYVPTKSSSPYAEGEDAVAKN